MADDPTRIDINQYKTDVPLTGGIPPQDVQPGVPLRAMDGYMDKAGGVATIGNELLRGFIRGHEIKAQKQAQLATKSIDLAQAGESSAYQNYQDSLRTGASKPGDNNDAAYQAYLKAHNATTDTMSKYTIPDKPPKGQKKKDDQPKDGQPIQPQTMGGKIKDFLSANPHIVPQLALAARTPKGPSMSVDTQQTKNTLESQANVLQEQQQRLAAGKVAAQDDQDKRAVESAGGIDAVLKSKDANPQVMQAATRMQAAKLDSQTEDGKLRDKLASIASSGGHWENPEQRAMAVHFGYAAAPKEETIEKGGYRYLVTLDPETNQPVKGSVPLKLGLTTEAAGMSKFYSERALDKKDIENAVRSAPEQYGVTMTGNKETDEAAVKMASLRVFSQKEAGLSLTSTATGRDLPSLQRDNNVLQGMVKQIDQQIGGKDGAAHEFEWSGGQKVDLTKPQMHQILSQFIESPAQGQGGIYSFKQQPTFDSNQKTPQAVERDRKWAYGYVKDRMLATPPRGKNPPMTGAEADAILSKTSLGQPIPGSDQPESGGRMSPPPSGGSSWWSHEMSPGWGNSGKMTPPPSATKMYQMAGVDGYVQLSEADVAKATAAGYQPVEIPAELLTAQ